MLWRGDGGESWIVSHCHRFEREKCARSEYKFVAHYCRTRDKCISLFIQAFPILTKFLPVVKLALYKLNPITRNIVVFQTLRLLQQKYGGFQKLNSQKISCIHLCAAKMLRQVSLKTLHIKRKNSTVLLQQRNVNKELQLQMSQAYKLFFLLFSYFHVIIFFSSLFYIYIPTRNTNFKNIFPNFLLIKCYIKAYSLPLLALMKTQFPSFCSGTLKNFLFSIL